MKCSIMLHFIRVYTSNNGKKLSISPLYSGNPKMGTFATSEDPDEMQCNAAFNQGLHCL